LRLNHLHLHVRDRGAAESFYSKWLGMEVVSRGEASTFLADEDGFDLALMDDREPPRMPPWFHFGYRLSSPREVADLHDRMSDSASPSSSLCTETSRSFRSAAPIRTATR
jgi:catechol 2,3-dioxygenase-like lactoylglutathione lyase family enzyme